MVKFIILLFILVGCKVNERPPCFDLKFGMSRKSVQDILGNTEGEFRMTFEGPDLIRFKQGKCEMSFSRKQDQLLEVKYEIFSKMSISNCMDNLNPRCVD